MRDLLNVIQVELLTSSIERIFGLPSLPIPLILIGTFLSKCSLISLSLFQLGYLHLSELFLLEIELLA